jgi:hypothetical protein
MYRVNTFRRPDLLKKFLKHYNECKVVNQIQVIWSDQENKAPIEWLQYYPENRVIFEIHDKDSLNNRFIALKVIPTMVKQTQTLKYGFYDSYFYFSTRRCFLSMMI